MIERLSRTRPVINNDSLNESFKKHLKAEKNLRRRQMKPLALPANLHPNSPLRNQSQHLSDSLSRNVSMSSFDSTTYLSQKSQSGNSSGLGQLTGSPIQNVSDFRRQVIASKHLRREVESTRATDKRGIDNNSKETLFQLDHNP